MSVWGRKTETTSHIYSIGDGEAEPKGAQWGVLKTSNGEAAHTPELQTHNVTDEHRGQDQVIEAGTIPRKDTQLLLK